MRKQNFYIIVFAIVLGVLLNINAQAAMRSRRMTFDDNLIVGGTVVKKGDYDVKFDNQTQSLLITRGKRVVAQAPARPEDHIKAGYTYSTLENSGGQPSTLTAIKLGKRVAVIQLDSQQGSNPAPVSPNQ
jgi:hypothetical protein